MARKKRNNRLLEDIIMLIVSVICSVLLIIAYFSPGVNPNDSSWPALLGLVFPVIYLFEVFLCLYWIIRWRVYSVFLLLILVMGVTKVGLFYRVDVTKEYEQERKRSDVSVMSYNVYAFIGEGKQMNKTLDLVDSLKPGILCLQEYQTTPWIPKTKIDSILSDYTYQRVKFGRYYSKQDTGWGLAVYSKYPIINSKYIEFDKSANAAMWVDLKLAKDTVRLYNLHLQSHKISTKDIDFLRNEMMIDSTAQVSRDKLGSILKSIDKNNKLRANQADSLAIEISRSPYPVIVCGDFNDTPISYTYRTIRGEMRDAFIQGGRGASPTYGDLFRIDYVLYSDNFTLKSYQTIYSDESDHLPVMAIFSY